jgi:uncharacterized protein YkwD
MSWLAAVVTTLSLTADPYPAAGRCRDGRSWTASPREQVQMLGLLNHVRADAARPPLVRHDVLDRMAMTHAVDMACRNYFDHKNPERDRLQDRLKRVNDGSVTGWRRLAEILGTSPTPHRQVDRWLGSRSHKRALLEEHHDRVGIGLVRVASGSRYITYWAVEFLEERR